MKIMNEFEVGTPIDQTWEALTDLERIAPCMPGAQLREVVGEEYIGIVKVKVGPITQAFEGVAKFVSQDRDNYRAVISAAGREQRGSGTAQATIVTELAPIGTGTRVSIATELAITGRAAQFGRSILQDVSSMLLKQFVQKLEADVLSAPPQAAPVPVASAQAESCSAAPPAVPAQERRLINSAPSEPIDLAAVSAASLNRRLIPALATLAALLGLVAAFVSSSTSRWLVMAAIFVLAVALSAEATASRPAGS